MDEHIEAIAADLESLSERLGDVSVQLLREAVENGETKRPANERKVSQARRAVDKAARILDGGFQSSI